MYLCCVIKYYQHINCSSLKEYGYKSEKNRNQKIKASCWICNCLWNIGHHLQPAMNPSLWWWHAPSLVRWTIDVPCVWRTPCSRPCCFRRPRLLRDFLLSSGSEVNGWFCCSLVALQHQSIVRLHLLTLHHHSMMTSSITKTPISSSLPAVDPFTNAGITHAELHPRSHENASNAVLEETAASEQNNVDERNNEPYLLFKKITPLHSIFFTLWHTNMLMAVKS